MAVWQIWIDTGGTFTDCLAVDPAGARHRVKVLSSGALRGRVTEVVGDGRRLRIEQAWSDQAGLDAVRGFRFLPLQRRDHSGPRVVRFDPAGLLELEHPCPGLDVGAAFEVCSEEPAPLVAARLVTGTPPGEALPPHRLRLATTLGTNALLQRRGAAVALFVTRGFGDLLQIGTQQRPELFALAIRRPDPLPEAVVEVEERLAADGTVLLPLDEASVAARARELLARGIQVAAVALVHAYRNPGHEQRLAALLRQLGFAHVCCSAELSPLITLLTRAETAVVDAYLAPLVGEFLRRIETGAGPGAVSPLLVMTSAGGLVPGPSVRPKDCLFSGPAGGVVGAALVGRAAGLDRVISFDMGGTSTDVARFDGDYDYRFDQRVGDAHLASAALAIETVAAGGGSICSWSNGGLTVGPASAGADPGPACYGAGGPLTLTDVNLLLGRLDPQRFKIPVDPAAARAALADLVETVERESGQRTDPAALLDGLLELANERMADAIRRVSLRRGYDPRDYALVAFGGAGPQHACGVAERLEMETILVPADAGLLSALGMGHAAVERIATRQVLQPLAEVEAGLESSLEQLAAEATAALMADGVATEEISVRRRLVRLRLAGQDSAITLDAEPGRPLAPPFAERFAALYGYPPPPRPIEVESLRVVVSSLPSPAPPLGDRPAGAPPSPSRLQARFGGEAREVPCYDRDTLPPGFEIVGPGVVMDRHSTTIVEPGWCASVASGALVLRRVAAASPERREHRPEVVALELFVGRLSAIAEEMGELLRRTALSTNIKERLDFSCALLDADGELVVNAPHIPVHLGSLGVCVRRLATELSLAPGDVVVTNHPAFGGSHLPDVTVVTPVFAGDARVGYVASRAHHAEIGGIFPGSLPPTATRLVEEGVVIPPLLLVARGEPRWEALERLLGEAPFPSRAIQDNLADVAAALAANHLGAAALRALAETHGPQPVRRQMEALKDRAERQVRQALAALPDGRHAARDTLDDGTPLCVEVEIAGDTARISFAGTADVHPGNLNATPAIVRGVVIYVLRLLVNQPLPLNEGLMRAVTLDIPPGLLDPPFPADPRLAPAVVGGNVETSQRLVDLLLRALGLAACSQGTMNNVVFGDQRFGYYETVGGGSGAGPGFCGASAVHSHMTNTKITDVEVLEQRYPVRVERFAIRRGSGGAGHYRGGDGAVREITFLAPMSLSLLGQRRATRPCGLAGGEPGASGDQRLVRRTGEIEQLNAIDGCEVEAGDRLILETPGGGGYGQ